MFPNFVSKFQIVCIAPVVFGIELENHGLKLPGFFISFLILYTNLCVIDVFELVQTTFFDLYVFAILSHYAITNHKEYAIVTASINLPIMNDPIYVAIQFDRLKFIRWRYGFQNFR